jgi:hypothetical protein
MTVTSNSFGILRESAFYYKAQENRVDISLRSRSQPRRDLIRNKLENKRASLHTPPLNLDLF